LPENDIYLIEKDMPQRRHANGKRAFTFAAGSELIPTDSAVGAECSMLKRRGSLQRQDYDVKVLAAFRKPENRTTFSNRI